MSGSGMSLKAKIRNLAEKKSIPAQVILQNYMFERFLGRLSLSIYKDKFVLKGGMLIAAIVGLDNRATMDLDTTLMNMPLTIESIQETLREICLIDLGDEVAFTVNNIVPIRDDDLYGGYRVMISAQYDTIHTPLSVDISTGDVITPNAISYTFRGIFDETFSFDLWAYNIETIMAEKVETILRRSVFNTRPRDYYDAYILSSTQKIDKTVFRAALKATASHRESSDQMTDFQASLATLSASKELRALWDGYKKQFAYAKEITYDMTIEALTELLF